MFDPYAKYMTSIDRDVPDKWSHAKYMTSIDRDLRSIIVKTFDATTWQGLFLHFQMTGVRLWAFFPPSDF